MLLSQKRRRYDHIDGEKLFHLSREETRKPARLHFVITAVPLPPSLQDELEFDLLLLIWMTHKNLGTPGILVHTLAASNGAIDIR